MIINALEIIIVNCDKEQLNTLSVMYTFSLDLTEADRMLCD